jgi:hypothetical protein
MSKMERPGSRVLDQILQHTVKNNLTQTKTTKRTSYIYLLVT